MKRRKPDVTILDHLCHPLLRPQCHEKMARRNYDGCLLILNKGDRLDGFIALMSFLTDRQYWQLLAGVWTDMEFPSNRLETWRLLLRSQRPGQTAMMNAAERRMLAKLPNVVRIYRASTAAGKHGCSWTPELETALFFRGYYAVRGIACEVWTCEIEKKHIIAFLNERNENEVVVKTHKLRGIELVTESRLAEVA